LCSFRGGTGECVGEREVSEQVACDSAEVQRLETRFVVTCALGHDQRGIGKICHPAGVGLALAAARERDQNLSCCLRIALKLGRKKPMPRAPNLCACATLGA